jgi:hexosaminidase
VKITESCTLKARSERGGQMSGRTFEKSFTAHKAMGRPVRLVTTTHPNYTFNCPDLLTDGLVGEGPYNSGDFAGWYNQPMEVVVQMDGTSYSNMTLSAFVFRHDYIFEPTYITVSASEDGTTFTDVAHAEYTIEGTVDDGNGCQEYTLTFPETSAKYLKVTAGCLMALPEWHSGKDNPGFVFVDEILVD